MQYWAVLRQGIISGLKTTWLLGKITAPVTFVVTVIQHTQIINWIITIFQPLMSLMGLPGEASIPLALGMSVNLYAGTGALLSLQLTAKENFIIALMTSIAHSLPVEVAIIKTMRVSALSNLALRVGTAILLGVLANLLWFEGSPTGAQSLISAAGTNTIELIGPLAIIKTGMLKALMGIYQLAIIIVPVMVFIETLKAAGLLKYLTIWFNPLISKMFKMSPNSSLPLLTGIVFGITYGAGVISQSMKDLNKRDIFLTISFLSIFHAAIEDTFIFVPAGVNPWLLLSVRLLAAVVTTFILSYVLKFDEKKDPQESIATKGL